MKNIILLALNNARTYISITLCLLFCSCNKFVETPKPSNEITSATVYSTDAGIVAALTGAYTTLANNSTNTSVYPPLFADDLTEIYAQGQDLQAQSNTYNNSTDFEYFSYYYGVIYQANDIILSLSQPGALADAVAKQAIGEAYFLRAFCYFELVNFYGDVPLVLTTNVNISALQGNTPSGAIYQSIISDLNKSLALVSSAYPTQDRARANKSVVSAMLSRVYLYTKQWANAEAAANAVINTGSYALVDVNNVFLMNSNETIWQFYNPYGYFNVTGFFISQQPTDLNFTLTSSLIDAFEPNDKRIAAWTQQGLSPETSLYQPYKYKQTQPVTGPNAEFEILIRLGEIYLIRAEARAEQNNITGSLADVNVIRQRAGLPATLSSTQSDLLLKIEQERRIELMFEETHRWFDLNRTGRTAHWLSPIKPTFTPHAELLPYPSNALITNPNLHQNPGY